MHPIHMGLMANGVALMVWFIHTRRNDDIRNLLSPRLLSPDELKSSALFMLAACAIPWVGFLTYVAWLFVNRHGDEP